MMVAWARPAREIQNPIVQLRKVQIVIVAIPQVRPVLLELGTSITIQPLTVLQSQGRGLLTGANGPGVTVRIITAVILIKLLQNVMAMLQLLVQ